MRRQENTLLPEGFDYDQVGGLSNELKAKLKDVRPENHFTSFSNSRDDPCSYIVVIGLFEKSIN